MRCDGANQFQVFNFNESVTEFQSFIAGIRASGGGDTHENVLGGMKKAFNQQHEIMALVLETAFRWWLDKFLIDGAARSFLLVIGDSEGLAECLREVFGVKDRRIVRAVLESGLGGRVADLGWQYLL